MDRIELLHVCKNIVQAEKDLNKYVDKLLYIVGVTREEVINGTDNSDN